MRNSIAKRSRGSEKPETAKRTLRVTEPVRKEQVQPAKDEGYMRAWREWRLPLTMLLLLWPRVAL